MLWILLYVACLAVWMWAVRYPDFWVTWLAGGGGMAYVGTINQRRRMAARRVQLLLKPEGLVLKPGDHRPAWIHARSEVRGISREGGGLSLRVDEGKGESEVRPFEGFPEGGLPWLSEVLERWREGALYSA